MRFKDFIRQMFNHVLRGNNLICARLSSIRMHNKILISESADLKDCPMRFNACNGCSITIEDDCLFSNNIEIHTSDYHPIYCGNEKMCYSKSVVIGKHSWIGLKSVLLKGVELAPNTIVGACSVVTKPNKKEYTAIAGNPAHEIKANVIWRFSEKESLEIED